MFKLLKVLAWGAIAFPVENTEHGWVRNPRDGELHCKMHGLTTCSWCVRYSKPE